LTPVTTQSTAQILREGETCWRKVRAQRVSFIVDAADYFAAAKEAILQAERCVYLIGWEFDLGIRLCPTEDDPETPDQLRQFLVYAAKNRPDLEIFILQWDGAMLFNTARQLGSYVLLKAQIKPQVHFRLDRTHPAGACHHQKIVVIDDALAFCGGIDMTAGRWDTSDHHPQDQQRRVTDEGGMPWHDMALALDGEAAKALGDLSRRRWKDATGHDLPAPDTQSSLWPEKLTAHCRDVTVGIARTYPEYGDQAEVNEVQELWTRAIGSARKSIYIENQFLSSGQIADALKAKLREKDGPEIVVILPYSAESWLESEAMDSARSIIIDDLREADEDGRLGIYHPVNTVGEHIYVHAKLLIVDDHFIRFGSSNMASRSLAFDTECDVAMEASDQPALEPAIVELRTRLIAEHLGMSSSDIETEIKQFRGSILETIERLRGKDGTTLHVMMTRQLNSAESALAKSRLMDPEEPVKVRKRLGDFAAEAMRRNSLPIAGAALLMAALAAARAYRTR